MPQIVKILPGCFTGSDAVELPPMGSRARAARLVAGLGFLVLAGFLWSIEDLAWWLRVAAAIPAWFGLTHLVASVTGYQGCPELGAVPSLFRERPVGTHCTAWRLIDRTIGADGGGSATCACGCRKKT